MKKITIKILILLVIICSLSFIIERQHCYYYRAHPPLGALRAQSDYSYFYKDTLLCTVNAAFSIPGMIVLFLTKGSIY